MDLRQIWTKNCPAPVDREVVWILGGGVVCRLLIALYLTPGFDEAYYTAYSRHLDWSYFDHPPLTALTTGIGIWLTGVTNQLTMRLGTIGIYTISLFFFYLTAQHLFGKAAGKLSLIIASSIPIFTIAFGVLTSPDSPLMLFWALTLWLAVREFFPNITTNNLTDTPTNISNSQAVNYPYQPTIKIVLIGLTTGLATLGKYHGFLLGACLVAFVIFTPRYWAVFRSYYLLGAGTLFLLAIAPIMIWNYHHGWVSIRFQAVRAIPDGGLRLGDILTVVLVGCAYLFPSFGFSLWWTNLQALIRQISHNNSSDRYKFILWLSAPIYLGFTLMGAYRQILPSWAMPGFFGAVLIMGNQMTILQSKRSNLVRNWLVSSNLIILILVIVALSHINLGTFQKGSNYAILGGFLTPENDASTQIYDLEKIRTAFTNNPELNKALASVDFVFTNRMFTGGQIAMAIEPLGKPVACFDRDMRGFAYWANPQKFVGQNALFIHDDLTAPNSIEEEYGPYFRSIQKLQDLDIDRGGQPIRKLSIYRASAMHTAYPFPY